MIEFLFFLVLCLLNPSKGSVSPPLEGEWIKSTDPERECKELHLCNSDNRTYYLKDRTVPFFNNESACAMLEREGIKKIFFVGDSYMRQIFQSFVITLTGDYEEGSVLCILGGRSIELIVNGRHNSLIEIALTRKVVSPHGRLVSTILAVPSHSSNTKSTTTAWRI